MAPQQTQPTGYQAVQPNYFTSVSVNPTAQPSAPSIGLSSAQPSKIGSSSSSSSVKAAGGDAFSSLLAGTSIKKSATPTNKGMTMADMAKQKSSAGIWGAPAKSAASGSASQSGGGRSGGSALNDLLG